MGKFWRLKSDADTVQVGRSAESVENEWILDRATVRQWRRWRGRGPEGTPKGVSQCALAHALPLPQSRPVSPAPWLPRRALSAVTLPSCHRARPRQQREVGQNDPSSWLCSLLPMAAPRHAAPSHVIAGTLWFCHLSLCLGPLHATGVSRHLIWTPCTAGPATPPLLCPLFFPLFPPPPPYDLSITDDETHYYDCTPNTRCVFIYL